ncbi:MAG: hypothetical protein KC912_23640 [Proteobacteria bacterium]|nr:hypothetical protein [Pseudomonadota bacterium]
MSLHKHLIGLFVIAHLGAIQLGSFGDIELGSFGAAQAVERAYGRLVATTRAPRRSYGAMLGPKQGWAMFSGVRKTTGRTEIRVLEGGRWKPVYVERSTLATWRGHTFDHYRWREALLLVSNPRNQVHWKRATDWILAELEQDYPDAQALQVRRMRAKMLSAEAIRAGERKQYDELLLVRGLRP